MLPITPHRDDSLLPCPVLVVEDDSLMRSRLARVLRDIGYVEDNLTFTTTLTEARQHAQAHPVALALIDLGLPDGNGIELIEELRSEDPALWILVISAWSTEDAILGALRAGATGYVLKERDDIEVSLSIRSVLRGGAPIDPFIARRILTLLPTIPLSAEAGKQPLGEIEVLSTREREILECVSLGLSNREIAEHLTISRHTVECHVKRIYRKLAVSSRTRAVNVARQHGLL